MKTLNISHSFTPIEISVPAQREWFVVFVAESQAGKLGSLSDLEVCAGDAVFRIHRNPEWPLYVLALPPSGLAPITNGKIALSVKVKRKTELLSEKDSVVVQASTRFQKIQALPAKGMFSVKWATKSRIAEAKRAKGKPVWAPEDFPLSHFDGASYLAVNASAREAVFSGKHLSGLEHFLREGKKNGLKPTISSGSGPNLGTREDLWRKSLETEKSLQSKLAKALKRIESFRKSNGQNFTKFKNAVRREGAANETIKELKEENELLLFHLHQVQEELEKYFHNNKDLLAEKDVYDIKEQNFQADLSRLNSEHKELTAQREAFQKDLETAKTQATEAEKKRAELAAQLEASAKSQEAIATECVALKKDLETAKTQATEAEMKCAEFVSQIDAHIRDRDQNKKTANERTARIAELEAQVADQAELQKLIDEQMARADAQLELLKDFMRTDL